MNYADPSGNSANGVIDQFVISLLSYAIMSIASIWDEKIRSDMEAIKWDPFNDDETIVKKSKKVSFYKGIPVVKFESNFLSSFSLGGIFINKNTRTSETTIKHEYGHSVQQMLVGYKKYLLSVFLPSSLYNLMARTNVELANKYYSMPWERTADAFGNVDRGDYSDYSLEFSLLYLFLIGLF